MNNDFDIDDEDAGDWQPSHGINEFVITEFTCGACHYLAAALHDLMGWPLVDELSNDGIHVHTFVRNAQGRAVDISGVHPGGWASTPYSDSDQPEKLQPGDRGEIEFKSQQAADYYAWALTLVQHFPEHFGIAPELAAGVDADAWLRAHGVQRNLEGLTAAEPAI